jgi:hypothetical protein
VPTIKFSAAKGIRRRQIVDALSLIKTRMISMVSYPKPGVDEPRAGDGEESGIAR